MRLNEAYSVPTHIVAEIARYDPDLRLRWARQVGKVRLERKVTRGVPLDPTWFKKFDDYDGCRDGYVMVIEFEPLPENWDKLLYTLKVTDLWSKGGGEQFANELEAEEQATRESRRCARLDDFRVLALDLYRHLNTVKTVPEGAGHHAYLGTGRGEAI